MRHSVMLKAAAFAAAIGALWLLYTLTYDASVDDPCASPQSDISGAVIADDAGDQDALVNRAIILKGKCNKDEGE